MVFLLARVRHHRASLSTIGVMLLVAFLAFGVGYLAGREEHRAPIIIETYRLES